MPLPLPYAPNIDATAERLRSVRAEAARPPVDVGAGVADAITTGMTLASALEAGKKKDAAEIFQKEYLNNGNEGLLKAYKDAGSPADFPIQSYLSPPGTPPEKVRETVLLGIKDLTGARDKVASGKAAEGFVAGVKAGKDPSELVEFEVGAAAPDKKADAIKGVADRDATAKRDKAKGEVAEKLAGIRAAATKTAASIRTALSQAKDAGVVAAIEREDGRREDVLAELDAAAAQNEAGTMSNGAYRKLEARLSRDLSSIDTRISAYITKVSDVSKIPETIKKPGASGTNTDASKEVENARAAITMGAPKVAVFDLYFKNNGSRHPDDTRK